MTGGLYSWKLTGSQYKNSTCNTNEYTWGTTAKGFIK